MRVDVTPRTAEIVPGQPLFLTVMITNTSTVIGGYVVRLLGADPGWVEYDGGQVSLFPDEVRVLTVTITPPKGIPAGVRRIAVQVRELTPPQDSAITDIDLTVPAAKSLQVRADPLAVTAGKRAGFSVIAENTGNTIIAGRLAGDDPEGKVKFAFDPEIVNLAPGEHAVVDMRARARRHFTGSPAVRQLGVYLDDVPAEAFFTEPEPDDVKGARGEAAAVAQATFIQKSVLSRGALSLVGLLIAVTVFALVITLALGRLVGQTTADRDLALQVAAARNDGGAASGTSGVAGKVTLLTNNTAVPAVSVSVFDAADTTKPLVTTATDGSGAYHVDQLAAGKYKLSFKGGGYIPMWYPAATSDADATTIVVKAGEQKHGLDIKLGGVPASISGTVVGDDVSAATLFLETVPGGSNSRATTTNAHAVTPLATADPGSPAPNPLAGGAAIVQKVPVGADGTFALTNVPSPSVYELVVIKTGYATTTQELDVAGGETRTGVQLTLRKGDGLITGTVTDPGGPLGNATITATSGQTTLTTVSLTDAAKKGQFTLRGLPTPSSFTLTATLAGHASQTLSLTLASGQKLTGVQITLSTSSGSLDGVVLAPPVSTALQAADRPAGGVTVTATDGLLTVQSETQSRNAVGAWHIGGLPVPGTYTLTFARSDLTSQTVSVSLDANGKPSAGANVDAKGVVRVTMQAATTKVYGKVLRACATTCTDAFGDTFRTGQLYGLGEATVTLNSGSTSYTVTTASAPKAADLGAYRIDNLPPGTYTLTVTAAGGFGTNSQVITIFAGVPKEVPVTLNSPAAITGNLVGSDGTTPLTDWTVYLYKAEQYPSAFATKVTTDSTTGAFTIDGVDPGQYLLALSPTPDPSAAVKTVPVTVDPGQPKSMGTIKVNWQS